MKSISAVLEAILFELEGQVIESMLAWANQPSLYATAFALELPVTARTPDRQRRTLRLLTVRRRRARRRAR